MKKVLIALIISGYFFFIPHESLAAKPWQQLLKTQKETRKEIKETVEEEGKEEGSTQAEIRNRIKEEIKETKKENKSLIEQLKEKFKGFKFVARINGTIKTIGTDIMTVITDDDKTYDVYVTDKTILRRRFWGKASWDEFVIGNKVNVIGKWKDETKTQIDAHLIRNISIQKRNGVFFGSVTTKNSDNFVMKAEKKGDQSVYFSDTTKFENRKEETIGYEDISVGHRVRVKGLWDSELNKITEVTEIKDFSLPVQSVKPSISPSITPSVTPSVTPTPTTNP